MSPQRVLVVVCLVHLALAVAFVIVRHVWWEEDETVYVSQVALHKAALTFTAPRARGMPILLWPVATLTAKLAVLRTYLALLSTGLLFVACRTWLRLGLGWLVPLGAALFASLWTASFFGAEAQPNFLVAVAALGACGTLLVALDTGRTRALVALGGWMTLLTLLRPSDATWLTPALLAAIWRVGGATRRTRVAAFAAVATGLVVGWGQWAIEAEVHYGGFLRRLHDANAENTPGLHFSLLTQAAAVNGPTLCRPCTGYHPGWAAVWWLAIPVLATAGLVAARGTRRFAGLALLTGAAVAILAEYVLTVSYAAPRFLLPTYLLVAVPCAAGLTSAVRAVAAPVRSAAAPALAVAVLVAALLGQAVTQAQELDRMSAHLVVTRGRYLTLAHQLAARHITRPCVVNGWFSAPVAYALSCNDHPAAVHVRADTDLVMLTEWAHGVDAFPSLRRVPLFGRHVHHRFDAYIRRRTAAVQPRPVRRTGSPTSRGRTAPGWR